MKRILALVLLAVIISANAFAQAVDQNGARLTATLGDQDSAKNYRLQCDTNGLCQFAQDTAITYPYDNNVTGASTQTMDMTDTGSFIVDYGGYAANTVGLPGKSATSTPSTYGSTYVLPACSTANLGSQFNFSTAVQEVITVTPLSTADTIAFSISGTGQTAGHGLKNSTSPQAGDHISVMCTSVGVWSVTDITTNWANIS